jgi:acetyl-CoA acetyltransferase
LAFGVDKLQGAIKKRETNREANKGQTNAEAKNLPVHFFAALARHYMENYGITREQLGQISVKSHFNASLNPNAHFQKTYTLEDVNTARMAVDPLTVLHCCPWDEGAAAVILCAREAAKKFTAKICPSVVASVLKSTPPDGDILVNLTELSALEAYETAGIAPADLGLVELHDAFTIEEILYTEALGLCERGQGGRFVEEGATALTGRHPVNSSGGLISMGHPIGPTGIGQIAEILWQMRGECGKRQIKGPVEVALAHMVGAGGVCVIHVLKA